MSRVIQTTEIFLVFTAVLQGVVVRPHCYRQIITAHLILLLEFERSVQDLSLREILIKTGINLFILQVLFK